MSDEEEVLADDAMVDLGDDELDIDLDGDLDLDLEDDLLVEEDIEEGFSASELD